MPLDSLHAGLLNLVNITQYFLQVFTFFSKQNNVQNRVAVLYFLSSKQSYMFYYQNVTPHYIPEKQISW